MRKLALVSLLILCVYGLAAAQGGDTPNPVLIWKNVNTDAKGSDGKPYIGITLGVSNYAKYAGEMFTSAPELPPCGDNKNASRTWLNVYDAATGNRIYGYCAMKNSTELRTFSFNVERASLPKGVYVVLEDRAAQKSYQSNCINTADGKPCPTAGGPTLGKINGGKVSVGKPDANPNNFKLAKPDLRLTYFYMSVDGNTLTARVMNACKAPVTASFPVTVIVYEGKTNTTKAIFNQTKKIESLAGGVSTDVSFDISQVAKGQDIRGKNLIVVEVDTGNYISEVNEKNNSFGISMPNQSIFPEGPCEQ